MVPYVVVIYTYSAIELKGPFLEVFLPISGVSAAAAAIRAALQRQSIFAAFKDGAALGLGASMLLFLSNFTFGARGGEEYIVREVSHGKGSAVNWLIDTPDRKNILLYVNIKGVNVSSNPNDVHLALHKGWLGYYFGNRT